MGGGGGDFNMVECPNKDRKGGTPSHIHKQGLVQLQFLKQDFDLENKWRIENDKKREYTWISRKQTDNIQSRLDRFYISKDIKHVKTEFLYNVWSDHKILSILMMLGHEVKRGQNYWKLDTEMLQHEQYRTETTAFLKTQKTSKHQYDSIIEWWEMKKVHIKMSTKTYCQQQNQKRQKEIAQVNTR